MIDTKWLRASDATGNAVLAHITANRLVGSTTIVVDSVAKYPAGGFIVTTGTLLASGYINPATQCEMRAHLSGGNIIIDSYEPGYTDVGNLNGQVAIIKQTTGFANLVQDSLVELQAEDPLRHSHLFFDFILANTGVWAGLGYGATLTAGMTALTCYIGGARNTVGALATRTFTANKDTYVDVLFNTSGVGTLVYTEVANNAASPALAANSIRLAIIVSGATIVNVGSINQGQENMVVPTVTATEFMAVTDSLGNLICPRDPLRRTLGYRQILSNRTTTSPTQVQVTGLRVPFFVPLGRKIRVEFFSRGAFNATAGANFELTAWEGTVASGTKLEGTYGILNAAGASPGVLQVEYTPTNANPTINIGFQATTGTGTVDANTDAPASVRISLV